MSYLFIYLLCFIIFFSVRISTWFFFIFSSLLLKFSIFPFTSLSILVYIVISKPVFDKPNIWIPNYAVREKSGPRNGLTCLGFCSPSNSGFLSLHYFVSFLVILSNWKKKVCSNSYSILKEDWSELPSLPFQKVKSIDFWLSCVCFFNMSIYYLY